MAAFVRTEFVSNYINLDKDARQRFYDALAGGSEASRKALQKQLDMPDFIIRGTTDSNTAALNAGAAQSFLMNLSDDTDDLGNEISIAFPSGFERDITIEAWTEDESGPNYQKIVQTVRGGSDPTLVNGVRNMTPLTKGRVTFASAVATAADAVNGFSITGAATATGRYAAAIPKARRVIVESMHITHVGTGDLTAVGTYAHLNALTLATGVIEIGIRAGAQENVAPADTAQLHCSFDVLPVESPELAIVTGTSPDTVIVGAVGQASENVNWLVHINVGELRKTTAATASE